MGIFTTEHDEKIRQVRADLIEEIDRSQKVINNLKAELKKPENESLREIMKIRKEQEFQKLSRRLHETVDRILRH
jgi:hypothetical protein